jgi:hypothetical protein
MIIGALLFSFAVGVACGGYWMLLWINKNDE